MNASPRPGDSPLQEPEAILLGAALTSTEIAYTLIAQIPQDSWPTSAMREVAAAQRALVDDGRSPDLSNVLHYLKTRGRLRAAGGIAYLGKLSRVVLSAAEAPSYIAMMRERGLERQLLSTAEELQLTARSCLPIGERVARSRALMDAIDAADPLEQAPIRDVVESVADDIREGTTRRDGDPPLRTGLDALDEILDEIEPGALVTIAGRPGMGKTLLAARLARSFASEGKVLFFPYEMTPRQIIRRSLASEAGVPARREQGSRLSSQQDAALQEAASRLGALDLCFVRAAQMGATEIASLVRRQQRVGPVRAIVIDYLQLIPMTPPKGVQMTPADLITATTGRLKNLAVETGIPIILVSQLNRDVEKRDDKRPQLSDLRGSGGIEQDSDVIILLYRDDYYKPSSKRAGELDAIVAKQREGMTGCAVLGVDLARQWIGNRSEKRGGFSDSSYGERQTPTERRPSSTDTALEQF